MNVKSNSSILRLGTRGSLLARSQSQLVADELMRLHSALRVELITIVSTGDRVQDRPLHDIGGKGLFTKELEQALLAGQIDFAVHSFKDVPVTMPLVDQSDLVIAAVPNREDPREVLAFRDPRQHAIPHGARLATSSLRRRCQLLELPNEITIVPVRGNIDTRLRKLRDGEFDVLVLAYAGLKRCGLFDFSYMRILEPSDLLPAPAQGALALQCRREDAHTRELLAAMDHPSSRLRVEAERAVVAALGGDCHSPIAVLAEDDEFLVGKIRLTACVGARDGNPPLIRAFALAPGPPYPVDAVVVDLKRQGVERLLRPNSTP
jgi:hydroxymethylbilane synthase